MNLYPVLFAQENFFLNPSNEINTSLFVKNSSEKKMVQDSFASLVLGESGIGIWSVEIGSVQVNLCCTAKSLIGENHVSSLSSLLRQIHRDDVRNLIVALKDTCRKKSCFEIDLRTLASPSSTTKWITVKGRFNDSHCSRGIIRGTITDTTKEKTESLRKEDYVSLMNHELRSPLTTIRLYIQMAIKQAQSETKVNSSNILKKAEAQTDAMARMIENFLTTSQLSYSSMNIVPHTFEMQALIREITSEIENQNPERLFEIGFSSSMKICADRDKIAQVLGNYLSNAVKYSNDGPIKVECRADEKKITISVSDCGKGIEKADQDKIFTRYYRTNPQGNVKGFGLGLFLAKEIITLHGGEVWLESKLNKGSTFFFSLPLPDLCL